MNWREGPRRLGIVVFWLLELWVSVVLASEAYNEISVIGQPDYEELAIIGVAWVVATAFLIGLRYASRWVWDGFFPAGPDGSAQGEEVHDE